MSSIVDRLAAAEQPVRPRQGASNADVHRDPQSGQIDAVTLNLNAAPGLEEAAWREEIKRVTGLDIPEGREVVLTDTRYWGNPETPNIYCKFVIRDRAATRAELEDLFKLAKKAKPARKPKTAQPRALVVAYADAQVGKVGSRGGTQELIERVYDKFDALEARARQLKCETAVLAEVGDCVESFENVASQGFTNDLSFPEQLRVARRLYTDAAMRLAKLHSRVVCLGVPSNHAQWRRGKDLLGRPGDDYGLETLMAVSDAFALNPEAFGHVEFKIPDTWNESMSIDLYGTIMAVTHGHQVNRPEGIPRWWADQVHGGQPSFDADILLTGHFHHARMQPTGRSPHTGRQRTWFQAPTLDNGSDWYRHRAGSDSDPGLMTFTVGEDGWDDLKIL